MQLRKIRRKKRAERAIVAEEGLPQMGPAHYLDFLPRLHEELKPKVYFEIGTESGASLSFSSCESIAVDPSFQIEQATWPGRTIVHLYQMPSDDFFASNALKRFGKIDLAFLDGMHLFEYLLRDFINIEKHMRADGVVTMHDCVPFGYQAAEREWVRAKTSSWTGDVWKIIPILKEYRPDLKVEICPLAPSGLVVIRDLSPSSTTLAERYDEIVEKWMERSLKDEAEAFGALLNLKEPSDFSFSRSKKKSAAPAA